MEAEDLSDWVALKSDIFKRRESNDGSKFICGWNDEASKLAITLHEGSRSAQDLNCKNKVCLLSIKEICNIHKQLSLINPNIESKFPSYISHKLKKMTREKIESFCVGIEYYLTETVNLIGKHIVLSTVFGEDDPLWDHEENLQEFKLKTLENTVHNNYKELDEILKLRNRAENLLEMKTLYVLEDEICDKIFHSISDLYNFRLQPFLELREIAYVRIREAKAKLSENVGPNIKQMAEKDFEKWTEESMIASEAVQQLYLEYYRKTLSLVEGQRNRMFEEQKKFGKAAFELYAEPRLLKLNIQVFQEELKLSNSLKADQELRRDKIKTQIAYLNCNDESVYEIQRIADEITQAQLDVLDAQLDVLNVEENLYKSQLRILNKEYEDKLEMGVFVDAVEEPDQLASIENPVVEPNPKVCKLKHKLGKIYTKRAAIRTKKNSLKAEVKKKKEMKEAVVEKNRRATAMTSKRKNSRETRELPPDKLVEERKKTLQRLKNYKKKAIELEAHKANASDEINDDSITIFYKPPVNNTSSPKKPSASYVEKKISKVHTDEKPLQPSTVSSKTSQQTLPPPPPPPPPPPSLTTSLISNIKVPLNKTPDETANSQMTISQDTIQAKLNSLKKSTEIKPVKAMQPFSVDEILSIRNKLKKPTETKGEIKSSGPADFSTILHATMKRIRQITEESDESDLSENSDFD